MTQNSTPNNVIYPANVSRLRKAWTYTTGNALESSPVVAGGIILSRVAMITRVRALMFCTWPANSSSTNIPAP